MLKNNFFKFTLSVLSYSIISQPLIAQVNSRLIKTVLCVSTISIATRYLLPGTYRISRYVYFKNLSYESRLKYALPFYYKLAEFYFEAINKTSRNEADLQSIVAAGCQVTHAKQSTLKCLWRYIDFEYFNKYKQREKFAKYLFLYYENKLKSDIIWLKYYINYLQIDGSEPYAQKKQAMRNLLSELERLHLEIQRSYTFEKENREFKVLNS